MYYLVLGGFIIGWSDDLKFLQEQRTKYGGVVKQSKNIEAIL